ncbi:hypothetical protein OK17_05500, partial [Gordonia sp. GN26]
ERVHAMLPDLPPNAQDAILRSMAEEDRIRAEGDAHAADVADGVAGSGARDWQEAPTQVLPRI